MKRQIELLDKQEADRLHKLNEAKKYQQQREAAADLMAEKRRVEEERIERQMQEKIREMNEKHNHAEREKKERMMYNRQVTNETLAAQIEEQRLRRAMDKAEATEAQERLMVTNLQPARLSCPPSPHPLYTHAHTLNACKHTFGLASVAQRTTPRPACE
jgi:hypothetical protein